MRGRPAMVGDLRLVRPVGSGGEGEVWEARDSRGRRRALKLIRPQMLASTEEILRRGEYLRHIDHPALVRVHRSGLLSTPGLEGWGFLEMDFVDGPSLAEAAADLAWCERLEPLAAALDLLHAGAWSDGVPLVHRDVKPANLVESRNGDIVLVDCSSLRGADSTQLTRIGTPVFAAPEVVTGRFGPAADVYSFAVTVVALATGARGERLAELLLEPWSLDLPEALCHGLSLRPEDRPASCLSVLGAGAGDWLPVEIAVGVPGPVWAPVPPPPGPVASVPSWSTAASPAPRLLSLPAPAAAWPDASPAPVGHAPPREAADPIQPRRVWPWTLTLTGLAAVAIGALVSPSGGDPAVWMAVIGMHLFVHVAARQSLVLAVMAPPVSWAYLLAARLAGPGRRRAWAEVALTGALMIPVTVAAVAVADPQVVDFDAVAGAILTAVAAVAAVVGACRHRGGGLLRTLLLPVWAVGAALTLAAAALLLPLSVLAGRPGATFRLAGRTLGSVAGFGRTREPQVPPWPPSGPA